MLILFITRLKISKILKNTQLYNKTIKNEYRILTTKKIIFNFQTIRTIRKIGFILIQYIIKLIQDFNVFFN